MMNAALPPEFSPLEHLVAEWAIEDGHERYLKRVNSSMDEIQAFYDAGLSPGRGSGRLHRQVRLQPNHCLRTSRIFATCSTR